MSRRALKTTWCACSYPDPHKPYSIKTKPINPKYPKPQPQKNPSYPRPQTPLSKNEKEQGKEAAPLQEVATRSGRFSSASSG